MYQIPLHVLLLSYLDGSRDDGFIRHYALWWRPYNPLFCWEILEPTVLPLLQATPHFIFQQDNAWLYLLRIVQASSQNDGYHCLSFRQLRIS